MKKVLVTGGAGFLGSHLCERLLHDENEVICVDNLYTGSMKNIEDLFRHPCFKFINHDIIKPLNVEIDQIYNLACPASPPHYQRNAIKTAKTNIIGAINMLELAMRTNSRILQASTSEVYGDPQVHPQPESYRGYVNPIGIRACYDEGKRMAEALFFDYKRQNNVDIKIIRIFNTYGPKMNVDDGRVVSNFIVQALKDEDITIYGNGEQTRSFCYVDDLIEGIVKMMNSKEGFTGPVNIGNPAEFTVKELADIIIDLTGSKSKLVYKPIPEDDPIKRKPIIEIAQNELEWKPLIKLEEGLKRTIEYFKKVI